MRRRTTKTLSGLCVWLLTVALAGCSASLTPPGASPEPYLSELSARLEIIDSVELDRRVVDALPNVAYVLADGSTTTVSDAVIVGTITAARAARDYLLDGEDVRQAATGESPQWRLVTFDVDIEEGWGVARGERTASLVLPVPAQRPMSDSVASIQALGRVLLILDGERIVHNEQYLGVVAPDGTITYPLMSDSRATASVRSLEDLRQALSESYAPRAAVGQLGL